MLYSQLFIFYSQIFTVYKQLLRQEEHNRRWKAKRKLNCFLVHVFFVTLGYTNILFYSLLFVINKLLLFCQSMFETQMMVFTGLAIERLCKAHLLGGKVAVLCFWWMEKAVLWYSYSHNQQQEVKYGSFLALHLHFVCCLFQKLFFPTILQVVSRQPVLIHVIYWPENKAGQTLLDLVPDKCSSKEWLWIQCSLADERSISIPYETCFLLSLPVSSARLL